MRALLSAILVALAASPPAFAQQCSDADAYASAIITGTQAKRTTII